MLLVLQFGGPTTAGMASSTWSTAALPLATAALLQFSVRAAGVLTYSSLGLTPSRLRGGTRERHETGAIAAAAGGSFGTDQRLDCAAALTSLARKSALCADY